MSNKNLNLINYDNKKIDYTQTRIIKRNLVYIIGIPEEIAKPEVFYLI
jgi:hypothetical protein